jgi:hypothetical protein
MAVLCNYMRHTLDVALLPNWESVCTNLVGKAPSYPLA